MRSSGLIAGWLMCVAACSGTPPTHGTRSAAVQQEPSCTAACDDARRQCRSDCGADVACRADCESGRQACQGSCTNGGTGGTTADAPQPCAATCTEQRSACRLACGAVPSCRADCGASWESCQTDCGDAGASEPPPSVLVTGIGHPSASSSSSGTAAPISDAGLGSGRDANQLNGINLTGAGGINGINLGSAGLNGISITAVGAGAPATAGSGF